MANIPGNGFGLVWDDVAGRWNGGKPLGTAVTITYSFPTQQSPVFNKPGYQAFDAGEVAAAHKALDYISSITGITFVETTGSKGEFQFGKADLSKEGAAGIGGGQNDGTRTFAGAVLINTKDKIAAASDYLPGFNPDSVTPTSTDADFGGFGWQLLLHEIGHALGLKHPFDPSKSKDPNQILSKDVDNYAYTIMSYTPYARSQVVVDSKKPGGGSYVGTLSPEGFSLLDIAALQYLYGTPKTAPNKTYTFAPTKPTFQTIYDTGAGSTVDFSAFKAGVAVDMNGGAMNSLPIRLDVSAADYANNPKLYDGSAALTFAWNSAVARAVGGSGNDTFTGNAAANHLDGGKGADTLKGGLGSDTYVVDNAKDVVVEAAGAGADTVQASVTFTLADNVENLTLTGTKAINGTGNALANIITGNAAANILDGKAGADTLKGLGGNDTYLVDNARDKIVEAAGAAGGTDTVQASALYTLGTGVAVEKLQTANIRATAAINLTGNEFAQAVTGNAGANILNGKGGADTLTGAGGNDTFLFNTALKTAGADTITDFANVAGNNDLFKLDNAVFTGLGTATGVLAAGAFMANLTGLATQKDDRIVYETDTGRLFYDADGVGGATGVQFAAISNHAKLTGAAALSAADFFVA